ncbi:ABC transporter permease [Streptomyces sp. ME19-01-6]|uniref:ABC transporter permease n=1 Tax=Streptomyces sp. ME19-01-6 TaxID=3028686 RepID=UPI0029BB4272|nr:FtsX-like permease family protein [Streptomyces sp. ME19-01-6]MDX3224214.1 FtsX-like permease family protein [Streptomyces sp. ME19-01-6]
MKIFGNGLARAAVRFKPAAFAGTFIALMLAAAIVSACGILLESGLRATVPPGRYASVPVVVAAEQRVGNREESEPAPDRVRLDASLVATAARTPGAAAAAPDLTFPVRGGDAALTAHGWGSAPFTGIALGSGTAPRKGEVVLDPAAARAARTGVGGRITLTAADGGHRFRVSGITRTGAAQDSGPVVWFTDPQARALSGHPGSVDAVLVRPAPGTTPGDLAAGLERALKAVPAARVHTGEGRGAAREPGLAGAKELLEGIGGSFGGIATMVAIFTTVGTVALSVGQRGREIALLRAVGATPRQIRRSIATEALLVAPLAGAIGTLPGIALAHWWFGQLRDRGAIPAGVELAVSWIPLVSAVGAGLVAALLAGLAAARRPARIKPGQALGEAAAEPFRPGVIRTLLGLAALAGGGVLAGVAAAATGDDAVNAALGVVMLFMLAVGLLGPFVARGCAWLGGLPLRAGRAPAALAAANAGANARRLASAITPLVLAMAFASTLVFMHTSEDHATAGQRRAGIVADHVLSAPGGLPADATARVGSARGVAAAVGVLRTGVLVTRGSGDGAWLESASAQGVSGAGRDLAAVQDLDIRTGSLDALDRGAVAVDAGLASSAHVKVGDRLRLRLPDGTAVAPKVVATYGRGLGLAQVTLARAALASHVTSAFDSHVLVRDDKGADPAAVAAALGPLGEVTGPGGYAAARDEEAELNVWANTVMAAVLGGFAAVAAANTLVMTVLDRRRELGMLRLIGSTRRQVLGMVRWEALLVVIAGVALGTAIALATLAPMTRGMTGEGPYLPPLTYAGFAGAAVALGLLATGLPARAVLRRGRTG